MKAIKVNQKLQESPNQSIMNILNTKDKFDKTGESFKRDEMKINFKID